MICPLSVIIYVVRTKHLQIVPLFEVWILDPVGEALSADPDAFQHTVTAQLVHDQRILHGPRSLGLIGDDAAHKVGVSRPQVGHQLVQVLLL